MTHYQVEIECRIAGIPCLVGLVTYQQVKGSFDYHAGSDVDYLGYTDIEYDVLDRNGRLAPWLERKMTDQDHYAICKAVKEYFLMN